MFGRTRQSHGFTETEAEEALSEIRAFFLWSNRTIEV
jgi:hypothetical protein